MITSPMGLWIPLPHRPGADGAGRLGPGGRPSKLVSYSESGVRGLVPTRAAARRWRPSRARRQRRWRAAIGRRWGRGWLAGWGSVRDVCGGSWRRTACRQDVPPPPTPVCRVCRWIATRLAALLGRSMMRAVRKCLPSWFERCQPLGCDPVNSKDPPGSDEVYAQVAAAVAESLAASRRQSGKSTQGHLRLSVPECVQDVTPKWLTAAMRLKGLLEPDGEVVAVQWARIGEGLGMMAECALVTIEVKGAKPDTPRRFVVKFAPKANIWDVHVRIGLRNEFHFYTDFTAKSGGLPHPACYLALSEHGLTESLGGQKPAFFLMIEYVENATAFSRIGACAEMQRLRPLMTALATFHARWWDHPPLEWTCHPEVGLGSVLFRSPYYASVLKEAIPALQAWPGNPYKAVLAWCPMFLKRMHTIVAHLREGPYTLLHNDVHLDNIFFTDTGGCSFIDMSNMIFGNSLQDVAFFLATNLTPGFRRAHERQLVGHYHRCLLAGRGVTEETFSFEQCWTEYRWQTLHVFLTFAVFTARTFDEQRRTQTGSYSSPSVRTPGEIAQLRIYQGDKRNTGFNGRLAAALVDLKCNELIEEEDARKRAQKNSQPAFYAGWISPGPRSTPGTSGTPSSVKLQHEDRDLLNMVKLGLNGWKNDEDEAAARSAGGRTLAERVMLVTSALHYRPYEVGAQKRSLINTYNDVNQGPRSPRL